jgi:toxin HigB-1
MRIVSIIHEGLKRLVLADRTTGVPPDAVEKVRRMVAFLQAMRTPEELRTLPMWRAHRLTGTQAGVWVVHVTRSWRLTFRITVDVIEDLNLEDEY